MRKFLISFAFLAGCSTATENAYSFDKNNPITIAYQYNGLEERKDTQQLKELLGVNPIQTEWCAAFVNAVLEESNMPGSDTVSEYPLTARSFLKWGVETKEPRGGDIVVFPRGNVSWQGHVGFYLGSVIIEGIEYYWILGGNQNNKVSLELYRASRALSVRRYNSSSSS